MVTCESWCTSGWKDASLTISVRGSGYGTRSPEYEVWCGVVVGHTPHRWFAECRQSCSRSPSQESVASRHQAW
jgi:hypothetical protein